MLVYVRVCVMLAFFFAQISATGDSKALELYKDAKDTPNPWLLDFHSVTVSVLFLTGGRFCNSNKLRNFIITSQSSSLINAPAY